MVSLLIIFTLFATVAAAAGFPPFCEFVEWNSPKSSSSLSRMLLLDTLLFTAAGDSEGYTAT